jgi:hypothetical protein
VLHTSVTRTAPGRLVVAALLVVTALDACGKGSGSSGSPRPARTTGAPSSTSASAVPGALDALQARALGELNVFTGWLRRYGVRGAVGEVGWPGRQAGPADSAAWDTLAERWFEAADRAGLWVTVWSTGEWWHTTYPLGIYQASSGGPLDQPNEQAAVLERHLGGPDVLRGVNDSGGEFGAPAVDPTSAFSNANPGVAGQQYHFDGAASFAYLRSRGVGVIRLPFRWERIQPHLDGPLDPGELGRLRATIDAAGAAGLRVILDLHNYGAYYLSDGSFGVRRPIGSPEVPIAAFADVWRRLAEAFRGDPAIAAYDLMNEPAQLQASGGRSPAGVWHRASQGAVEAIRSTGDGRTILVEGYFWASAAVWTTWNPRPWIQDRADDVRYEAHQYWDADRSGTYAQPYAQVLAEAEGQGWSASPGR